MQEQKVLEYEEQDVTYQVGRFSMTFYQKMTD